MNLRLFSDAVLTLYATQECNRIPAEKALTPELAGAALFDPPIFAVADAQDDMFQAMRQEGVVGPHALLPTRWLPGAKSVVSFFFPFTVTIRDSNRADMRYPSPGWLNGRIEGQDCINHFAEELVALLMRSGYAAIAPALDRRFFANSMTQAAPDGRTTDTPFTSNWSERHVAYACGLGTFGLSKGLITDRGTAGRFTSIVTALHLPPSKRQYTRHDAYCTRCGKCVENCPVGAIDRTHGKDHVRCSDFLDSIRAEHAPRYGCGKCQINVPCEWKNPTR